MSHELSIDQIKNHKFAFSIETVFKTDNKAKIFGSCVRSYFDNSKPNDIDVFYKTSCRGTFNDFVENFKKNLDRKYQVVELPKENQDYDKILNNVFRTKLNCSNSFENFNIDVVGGSRNPILKSFLDFDVNALYLNHNYSVDLFGEHKDLTLDNVIKHAKDKGICPQGMFNYSATELTDFCNTFKFSAKKDKVIEAKYKRIDKIMKAGYRNPQEDPVYKDNDVKKDMERNNIIVQAGKLNNLILEGKVKIEDLDKSCFLWIKKDVVDCWRKNFEEKTSTIGKLFTQTDKETQENIIEQAKETLEKYHQSEMEQTMSDKLATTNNNSFLDMLKDDAEEALYRSTADNIRMGIKSAIVMVLKNNEETSPYISAVTQVLNTKLGEAFISAAIGLGLMHIPTQYLKGYSTAVQRLSTQFRVGGIKILLDEVSSIFIQVLLPVILEAIKALPKDDPQKIRVASDEPINKEEAEEERKKEEEEKEEDPIKGLKNMVSLIK